MRNCSFSLLYPQHPAQYLAGTRRSMDDYSVEFLTHIGCATSDVESKDCESQNGGCLTISILLFTCCIKLRSVCRFKKKKVQPETVVKGILLWHYSRCHLKENNLYQKMTTRFFMMIEEAYSKLYGWGFASHSFKCLLPALPTGFCAAELPILWVSPHWGLLYDCHTVLIYIYDFHIPNKF